MSAVPLASTAGPPAAHAPSRHTAAVGRMGVRVLVVIGYAIIFAPIVTVIVISFFDQEIVSVPPPALTLRWYVNAWGQRDFARGFLTSFQVALAASAVGVPIGTAAALAIVRGGFRGREALNTLLLAPLAVPAIVAGSALYLFFISAENVLDIDIKGTLPSLVAANALLTIPWTVRLVGAGLAGLDRSAEEAAANLGARPLTVFRRVTLPLMHPGIVAAALFSFVASFENLELNLLLVGPGRVTLPVAMLSYLEFRMDPTLAAVAAVQITIITILMLVTDRFVKLSRVV